MIPPCEPSDREVARAVIVLVVVLAVLGWWLIYAH
jgi:hypothetical protein